MNKKDKIYIAGHRGMVGSAIVRKLKSEGFDNIVTRGSKELDLKEQSAVREFFANRRNAAVISCRCAIDAEMTGGAAGSASSRPLSGSSRCPRWS